MKSQSLAAKTFSKGGMELGKRTLKQYMILSGGLQALNAKRCLGRTIIIDFSLIV